MSSLPYVYDASPSDSSLPRAIEDNIVFVGDSLTSASSLHTRVANIQSKATITNDGNGGDTISDLVDRASTTDGYLGSGTNRLFVLIGTNDILDSGGSTASVAHAELKAYCLARKAAGWRVSVCSLPRQDGLVNASTCLAYSILIQQNWQDYADELIDLDSDPRLQDSTDTIYFNGDEVHLTTAGYNVVGSIINARYASPSQATQELLTNYGSYIVTTSVRGKANQNTRIDFSSNYMDHYYNNAFVMRVGNGAVAINPGAATYDFTVYADDASIPFQVDTSANGGAGHILMNSLPTSDPSVAGALWVDTVTLKVSAG